MQDGGAKHDDGDKGGTGDEFIDIVPVHIAEPLPLLLLDHVGEGDNLRAQQGDGGKKAFGVEAALRIEIVNRLQEERAAAVRQGQQLENPVDGAFQIGKKLTKLLHPADLDHALGGKAQRQLIHTLRGKIRLGQGKECRADFSRLLPLDGQIPVIVLQESEQQRHQQQNGGRSEDDLVFQGKAHRRTIAQR